VEKVALTGVAEQATASHAIAHRPQISFRSINRRGEPGFLENMQRHHLLPRQLLRADCFGGLFQALGHRRIGFDDFRANGLLLPAATSSALATGLPLHRGPHRVYNELVAQRVGQVEASWKRTHLRAPHMAREEALMRLRLLQSALRRRLMQRERRGLMLNRKDPFRTGVDFTELDAMAELLWSASEPAAQGQL